MTHYSSYQELDIYKLAREICIAVWELIKTRPLEKEYKLSNQINGSTGSIMDNIAEGFERDGNKEFIHFLSIAKASCGEVRSQLYRCMDRNHVDEATFVRIYDKVILNSKKIKSFMVYLKNSDRKGSKFD